MRGKPAAHLLPRYSNSVRLLYRNHLLHPDELLFAFIHDHDPVHVDFPECRPLKPPTPAPAFNLHVNPTFAIQMKKVLIWACYFTHPIDMTQSLL